jgi:hypothetical protein
MKNIQVIDPSDNAAYNIYAAPEADFDQIFPNGADIEFIEDLLKRLGAARARAILEPMWERRLEKPDVIGIHGTLFYHLKKQKGRIYPNKRFSDDGASQH